MFYLYHHNDLHRLADIFSMLRSAQSAGPLQSDQVLVPNAGLGRWLKMHVAERDGIAANMETLLSAPFLWNLISSSLPGGQQDSSAYQRENLRWHLYALLPEISGEVVEIARYLEGDNPEVRRWQLAEQLASIFDEYLIYRRTMLLGWERGTSGSEPPENWQAPLWRALVSRLGRGHRARALGEFVRRAEAGEPLERRHWPERVYCFALGTLPPDYLRLLYALAQTADVHFFMHNPSEVYWGDIQAQPITLSEPPDASLLPGEEKVFDGHPLLASLGRPARDFIRLIYSDEFDGIRELELGDALKYEDPGDATLLKRLQSGVIRMQAFPEREEQQTRERDLQDRSFQVHACHGVLREVQVLHDQLLSLLAEDEGLHPRDIIVMMPDVGSFAPAIEAVFGAATDESYVPFNLSDQPLSGTHPILQTFRLLLDLPLWRWTAEEVLRLIEVPAVRRRFDLDEADAETLRRWVQRAGVRWGIDADHRARAGAGRWDAASWDFGLDRLLAGVAVSEPDVLVHGIAAEVDLEGGATAALGQFWLLLDRLKYWHHALNDRASPEGWQERLNAFCDDLFAIDEKDRSEQSAMHALGEAIATLDVGREQIGGETISWEAIRELLGGELAGGGARQPFLSGGVTFCGLVPLRTVPFRVVCILGLDEGAFPRAERGRSMNLIRRNPRLGDISVRDDDRLLFLQWLLCAKDVFYLSYTGQDTRSGESLPPSTVVAQLLDFIASTEFPEEPRKTVEKLLVTKQPMQPFSPRYYAGQPGVFTYRRSWREGTLALYGERTPLPGLVDGGRVPAAEIDEIELGDLKRFFANPARWFLRDVMLLDLDIRASEIKNDEMLQPDGLEMYALRQTLFERALESGRLPDEPPELLVAKGVLPPEPLHIGLYMEVSGMINDLLEVAGARKPTGSFEPQAVDVLLFDGLRLTGQIADVMGNELWRVEPRKVTARHLMNHWFDLLALAATNGEMKLSLFGIGDREKIAAWEGRVDPEAALSYLRSLAQLFLEGQCRPLRFMPGLAGQFVEQLRKGDPQAALDYCNAASTFDRGRPYELDDPWFRRLLLEPDKPLGRDATGNEFCDIAIELVGTMQDAFKIEEIER